MNYYSFLLSLTSVLALVRPVVGQHITKEALTSTPEPTTRIEAHVGAKPAPSSRVFTATDSETPTPSRVSLPSTEVAAQLVEVYPRISEQRLTKADTLLIRRYAPQWLLPAPPASGR